MARPPAKRKRVRPRSSTHAGIHGLDITGGLDLPRTADDDATRLVLDTLTGGVAGHFGVDLTGRALAATDLDWTFGSGTPVRATAGDLVLALAGRSRPALGL